MSCQIKEIFPFFVQKKRTLISQRSHHIIYSASRTRTYDIMINSQALLPTELLRNNNTAWQRPSLTGGNPQLHSALRSLTSVFEMGTGVASPLLSPDFLFFWRSFVPSKLNISSHVSLKTIGQVFDLLVSVSWMHYCTYTSDLSTW